MNGRYPTRGRVVAAESGNCRVIVGLTFVWVCVSLAGCRTGDPAGGVGKAQERVSASPAPLLAREVLFAEPTRSEVRISPDGAYVSYLAPLNGVRNVWVAPLDDPEAAEAITTDTNRGIPKYAWTYREHEIVYLQDKEGNENWRLYGVDVESRASRDLTPLEKIRAQIIKISPQDPRHILVGINNRIPRNHDVYKLNLETGELLLIEENPFFLGFDVDQQYRLQFALRLGFTGGVELFRRGHSGAWLPYGTISRDDTQATRTIGFSADGQWAYMFDSRGRDTAGLFRVDLETAEKTLLASHAGADIREVVRDPETGRPIAAGAHAERLRWQTLDPRFERDFEYLRENLDGDFYVEDQTAEGDTWLLRVVRSDGPEAYYTYRAGGRGLTRLFADPEVLVGVPLARMRPVSFEARDGLLLYGYLTLPLGSDPDGDGVPREPLGLVLQVHGGPWSRVRWSYDPVCQLLANRGYAVLAVNYRGSRGYGKQFLNAGNLEWGGKMHTDLVDAVDWAVARGVADRQRLAILGEGYGGYAALWALAMEPELFACGVDLGGPVNLVTMINQLPAVWMPLLDMYLTRVGNLNTDEGRALLESRSPAQYADQIRDPLLVGQIEGDMRGNAGEAERLVEAVSLGGVPATYVVLPGLPTDAAMGGRRSAFFAIVERFLAAQLGGRFEDFGCVLEETDVRVPRGAEHVEGLAEELENSAAGGET